MEGGRNRKQEQKTIRVKEREWGLRALRSTLSSVSRIINEISEFSGHYSSNAKAKDTHTPEKRRTQIQ